MEYINPQILVEQPCWPNNTIWSLQLLGPSINQDITYLQLIKKILQEKTVYIYRDFFSWVMSYSYYNMVPVCYH